MYYTFPAFARLAAIQRTLSTDEVARAKEPAPRDEQPPAPAPKPLSVTALE